MNSAAVVADRWRTVDWREAVFPADITVKNAANAEGFISSSFGCELAQHCLIGKIAG